MLQRRADRRAATFCDQRHAQAVVRAVDEDRELLGEVRDRGVPQLVQGRAHGTLSGTLEDLRALVARTQPIVRHEPHGAVR